MNLPRLGVRLAPALALFFGLCVVGGLVAMRIARRRARTTGFGVVRERALYTARRWMVATGLLALLGGASVGLWATAVYHPEVLPTPAPTATSTLIPSPTPRPPTATPTLIPTPTSTPVAARRQVPTPEIGRSMPKPLLSSDAATPGPNAALVDWVLAAGQVDNEPVRPANHFPEGTSRVYAFLTFEGMAPHVPWSHVWYVDVDGQLREVWRGTELWPYEYANGRRWRYLNCRAGRYELHVYVGQELQQKLSFVVKGGG